MIPSSFHTHTCLCDGKNTPEELAREAYRLGCPALGFSGHAYTPYDLHYHSMTPADADEYVRRVTALKKEYEGRMNIFLGIEQDLFCTEPTERYEYVIGSVHYIRVGDEYLAVDESRERQIRDVNAYFGGDFYAYAEAYFENAAQIAETIRPTIIGHFDLVTKYNEGNRLFDTAAPRYRKAAERALDALLQSDCVFEINTGAMARGLRTTPYPEDWMIKKIRQAGNRLLYTSDCHDKAKLLYAIPQDAPADMLSLY